MRFITLMTVNLSLLLACPGVSLGQKVLAENPFYLRSDNRLQVALNVQGEHANLAQIVASLRQATGLELNIDGNLQHHQPDFGVIQPSNTGFRAWQLMEMIAKKDLENGY